MPHVKIEAGHENVTGQLLGWGTRIVVDGKPLQDVTDINLHFGCDKVVECDVVMLVKDGFEFEGNVDLNLHIHLPEGCKLIETTTHDSEGKEHRVVRVQVPDDRLLDRPSVGHDVPGGGANP